MQMVKKSFCILFLIFFLVSCATPTATPTVVTAQPTDAMAVTLDATPTSLPSPTAIPPLPRTVYRLSATLDYQNQQVSVEESITYTNRSEDPLSELQLVVESNGSGGVFSLTSAKWEDGSDIQNQTLDSVKMTIPLKEPLQPKENVNLILNYVIQLPLSKGTLSYTTSQVNMAGWYPYVAPYISGQGFLINKPGFVGEYQISELADFSVDLKVEGVPDGFVVAASAAGTHDLDGYHYSISNARNFTWSGSSNYHLLEGDAGSTHVQAYVFVYDLASGQVSLDTTIQAIEFYEKLYGPYPHDTLTIVEANFPDGMEYDGLYFLGQEYFNTYTGVPNSYLVALSAHETAHQWFYAQITNDQANEPWLDEALCIYNESLFYEYYHPDLVNLWWQFRVEPFEPKGWVNSTIYDFYGFRPYVDAVYLRGALFFKQLREQIGDDAFRSFLQDYFTTVHTRAGKDYLGLATGSEFWQILSENTSYDYTSLKQQYFSEN